MGVWTGARLAIWLPFIGLTACDGSGDAGANATAGPPGAGPPALARESPRCVEKTKQAIRSIAETGVTRDVLVLIDQTTTFPETVRDLLSDQISALALPGTRVSIGTFSAYTQSSHARVEYSVFIEPEVPDAMRNSAPMKALKEYDKCLAGRRSIESQNLMERARAAISEGQPALQRTDLISSVKAFGGRLRTSEAREKILLLASDMLENSESISFYANGGVRTIDAAAELAKVEQLGLLADMPGTNVYVIGAGLASPDTKLYRPDEQLRPLEAFWREYFEKGGATLVDFGKPALLRPVG